MKIRNFLYACILGVVLWYFALWALKLFAPVMFADSLARLIACISVIPGSLIFVWLIKIYSKATQGESANNIITICIVGLLLDGLVFMFKPDCYGQAQFHIASAAWLLWGVGCILTASFLTMRRSLIQHRE
jgi:hypothetical protein